MNKPRPMAFTAQLRIWIRRGIPKRKATFKDVLDGLKNQAISGSLLIAIKPLWDLAGTTQHAFGIFLNSLLVCLYAIGVFSLLAMSIYQTIYAVDEASFFYVAEHRRKKSRLSLIAIHIWAMALTSPIFYAGAILCFVQWRN